MLGQLARGDRDRGGAAGRHARRLHAIDAEVHQRSTSGQLSLGPPLGLLHHERESTAQARERPPLLTPREPLQLIIMRLELQPVADRQLHVVRAAGADHRIALGHAHGHRLLADDVLARAGDRDHVRRMEGVGGGDIDDVDVGITRELGNLLVVVDVPRGETVLLREGRALVGRARDHAA